MRDPGQVRGVPVRRSSLAAGVVLLATAACRSTPPPEADVIVRGGVIHTLAGGAPAAALAIRGGRVLASGDEPTVLRHRAARTRVIDLAGSVVVPGFGDAHVRPFETGERLLNEAAGGGLFLDLRDGESEEDVVQRVRARARALGPGAWVLGAGWDETRWVATRPPDKRLLSDIVAYNPVLLARAGGGAAWVNARALDLAGIDGRTPDPPGGRIEHERAGGAPTGLLVGRASELVLRRVPHLSIDDRAAAISMGLGACPALGLTMVSAVATGGRLGLDDRTAGASDVLQPWRDLAARGRLNARVALLVPAPSAAAEALVAGGPEIGLGEGRLDIAIVLLEAGDPPETADLATWARRAAARGLGVAIAARGHDGIAAAMAAFAEARGASSSGLARLRLELPLPLDAADLAGLASAGVAVTVQAPAGDLKNRPLAAAREAGIDLAAGSGDAVGPAPPLAAIGSFGLAWAGTSGDGAQRGRREALRMITLGPARAAGRAGEIGCLAAGCRADFVILSRDPLASPGDGKENPKVLATWMDGREIFSSSASR